MSVEEKLADIVVEVALHTQALDAFMRKYDDDSTRIERKWDDYFELKRKVEKIDDKGCSVHECTVGILTQSIKDTDTKNAKRFTWGLSIISILLILIGIVAGL